MIYEINFSELLSPSKDVKDKLISFINPVIYRIRNIETGKCYIGSSKNIYKRLYTFYGHVRILSNYEFSRSKKRVRYIHEVINELGCDKFIFSIEEESSIDLLDDREKYYISMYDSFNNGYNKSPDGSGGFYLWNLIGTGSIPKGYIGITNGEITKFVSKEDYNLNYDKDEWVLGSTSKGLILIHKDGITKRVRNYELNDHLSIGWKLGLGYKSPGTTGRKVYHSQDGLVTKFLNPDVDKEMIESEGWIQGHSPLRSETRRKNKLNKNN